MTGQQLPLNLPHRTALERGDFFVAAPNAVAVAQIDAWPDWPQRKLLLLGPVGAGKTHLAHVWAAQTGALVFDANMLAQADIDGLAQCGAVVVEDCDALAGNQPCEEQLFHLHNLLLAEGGSLLMTGRNAPKLWPFVLPDLASRIQGTAAVTLQAPDDTLLAEVLKKLLADRQLTVADGLIPYLLGRMERSFAAAQWVVDALDRQALAENRKVTTRLAAQILDNPKGSAP
ncbi:chromosomal replication initiator protein DnaA [Actibacterium mucosum KCTC 23349]|uniref:Chromosomal replication initiator protein DnaA n=1 Tax=Actibacterium mucosum KCTC 23349 TaxID=1454373 RepID=A0A037ZNX4_9RHOB|nr:DnaA/Hda family protein [Actibacterium mucosum]KAJ56511.1 chromosomal replication initiator protein DnaA [Actibacterium mucosum KCTC 23349]